MLSVQEQSEAPQICHQVPTKKQTVQTNDMAEVDHLTTLGNTKLRTPETFAKYHNNPKRKSGGCFMCVAPVITAHKYWSVIDNEYPYDAVAESHKMLIPKRHVADWHDLSEVELDELSKIKFDYNTMGFFDVMMENFSVGRSFLSHYHVHLIKWIRV